MQEEEYINTDNENVTETEIIEKPTRKVNYEKEFHKIKKTYEKHIETLTYQYEKKIKKIKKTHEKEIYSLQKKLELQAKTAAKFKHLIDTKGLRGHKKPVKLDTHTRDDASA